MFIGFCLFKKIAADLSKHKALDADSRAIQQIIITGKANVNAMIYLFIFYLLCLSHFYENTKIQNTFTNIILHKTFMKLKEEIYIYSYKFSKTNIEATPRSP